MYCGKEASYIKQCKCGYWNFSTLTRCKGNAKALTENGYICESCGRKYREYRFCRNAPKGKPGEMAERCEHIKIKSNKTGSITDALRMRDGTIIKVQDGKLHRIKQQEVVVLL